MLRHTPPIVTALLLLGLISGCLPARLDDVAIDQKIAAAVAGKTRCADVADCLVACGADEPCQTACQVGAGEETIWKTDDALACYKTRCTDKMCAASADPTCGARCAMMQCPDTLLTCLQTSQTGTANCGETLEAIFTCNMADGSGYACMAEYYDALGTANRSLMEDLGACAELSATKGADPLVVCLDPELARCVGDGIAERGPCYPVYACLGGCAKGADAAMCLATCLGTMDDEAWDAYDGIKGCQDFKGDSSEPSCKAAMVACAAPVGAGACGDASSCASECSGKTISDAQMLSCVLACAHETDEDSAQLYIDALYCDAACRAKSGCVPKVKCATANGKCLTDK